MKWSDFEVKRNVHRFDIDYYSKVYERRFKGSFTCSKQTFEQSLQIEVLKTTLSSGFTHDPITGRGISRDAEYFCNAIATCKLALTSSPDWFDVDDLEDCKDVDLVLNVAQEVFDYEASFRSLQESRAAEVRPEGNTESQGHSGVESSSSSEQREKQQRDSVYQELVDEEVPTITKVGRV